MISDIIYIGIDPGMSGSIAICDRGDISTYRIDSLKKVKDILSRYSNATCPIVCYKEDVHACGVAFKTKQKVSARSQGVMMRNVGWLEGVLLSYGIEWIDIKPRVWQDDMGVYGAGSKELLYDIARLLYPDIKVTKANQDALLIMRYGMNINKES